VWDVPTWRVNPTKVNVLANAFFGMDPVALTQPFLFNYRGNIYVFGWDEEKEEATDVPPGLLQHFKQCMAEGEDSSDE